jgi:hypothetical protein
MPLHRTALHPTPSRRTSLPHLRRAPLALAA